MDMGTRYLGLDLKNPIIAGSSPYTGSLDTILSLEKAGVGAVVLKSLFEEEITGEAASLSPAGTGSPFTSEADDYLNGYIKSHRVDAYLELVSSAREKTSLPVIASINARSASQWIEFASRIEKAGAHALEINLMELPSDRNRDGQAMEEIYRKTALELRKKISIPISMKMGCYFSSPASTFEFLVGNGINGLVLFNRFVDPDIDINTMRLTQMQSLSDPKDLGFPLRWIGILSPWLKCDIAASTGVHDGAALIKTLLAGAKAAYIVSVLYKKGFGVVDEMLEDLQSWMKKHGFTSIEQFRGKCSIDSKSDAAYYERSQFMKYFSSYSL